MAKLKKHAFGIALAGHGKSLCGRFPGWDRIMGDDTKVDCKDCIREMTPYRRWERQEEMSKCLK